jgi:hypothetical protein
MWNTYYLHKTGPVQYNILYFSWLECSPLPFTSDLVLYLQAMLGAYH